MNRTPRSAEAAGRPDDAVGGGDAGTLDLRIAGVGLIGPRLPDWAAGQALLREPARWTDGPMPAAVPQRLAPAERRRAGAPVKISLVVADEAVRPSGIDAAGLATVFSSSSGDTQNCHVLCEVLAGADRLVSPTRFTNSVHNAAAGYWHIATASRAPSTSLCAYDHSFGAGLLEAATQALALERPVLLVAADVPYPEPLHAKRPLPASFGVALLLAPAAAAFPADAAPIPIPGAGSPAPSPRRLRLRLHAAEGEVPTPCATPGLEALRAAVPAARALPLLQALAGPGASRLSIEAAPGLLLALQVDAA